VGVKCNRQSWTPCYLREAARILQSSGVPAVYQLAETVSAKSLARQVRLELVASVNSQVDT
jgi:hypothetical protein